MKFESGGTISYGKIAMMGDDVVETVIPTGEPKILGLDDIVQVVRCKNCKYGEIDDPDFPNQYYCHAGCGWNDAAFYCSYGERR